MGGLTQKKIKKRKMKKKENERKTGKWDEDFEGELK